MTALSGTNYLPVVLASSSTAGSAIPSRSVQVSGSDGTNARNISTDTSGNVNVNTVSAKAPLNATGSGSAAGATVSTVATLTAPANAVGFILMNLDTSTTNMRWAVGRTASTTLGQQLQPGRDTGFVPVGANVSIIAESGTVTYDIQWVSQ